MSGRDAGSAVGGMSSGGGGGAATTAEGSGAMALEVRAAACGRHLGQQASAASESLAPTGHDSTGGQTRRRQTLVESWHVQLVHESGRNDEPLA